MVEKKTVVYTFGVFDVLHLGHIKLLERAKALGDYLIVGIVSDKACRELKGSGRPINGQIDRKTIINALSCVDRVIYQDTYDPSRNLNYLYVHEYIKVNILTKGDDWNYIPGTEVIEILGGKLVKLPYTKGYSTTNIIRKIRK